MSSPPPSTPPSSHHRRAPKSRLKTLAHLSGERRMPSEYEIATSQLLYYTRRGFEVNTPLREWYAKHQAGSPLTAKDWERFVDPRETTYTKYTARAHIKETYLDGIFASIEQSDYDAALSPEWRTVLARLLSTLRFPLHGLQMMSAYVGQMAPSGRITIAAMFQTADELRRIQRIAYRLGQLRLVHSELGSDGREIWQRDPAWQPLREAIERGLVTYDWGEALILLNLCLKPVIDDLFMVQLPQLAKEHGDYALGQIFSCLAEDCQWHEAWTLALLGMAIEDREMNRNVISDWVQKWARFAFRAAEGFDFLSAPRSAAERASGCVGALLSKIGVEAPRP